MSDLINVKRSAELLARVAWLYYEHNLTHQEIAERLGLSRIKVTRLLAQARQEGIVSITVRLDPTPYVELEAALCAAFALDEAIISFTPEDPNTLRSLLAQEAASLLLRRAERGMRIGLGLGHTLALLPLYLQGSPPLGCHFTTLTGGLPPAPGPFDLAEPGAFDHNFDLLFRVADLTASSASTIMAPALVAQANLKTLLESEPGIAQALAVARSVDLAMFSVGGVQRPVTLQSYGLISDEELHELISAGAVGDALGRFYDKDGQPVAHHVYERLIGLNLEELRNIRTPVLVAGGPAKRDALLAALGSGMARVFITDAETASWLLAQQG